MGVIDATPTSTRKRKRVAQRQSNAEAGPSTQRQRIVASPPSPPAPTVDAPAPTRSGRVSKPTMKKAAFLETPKKSPKPTKRYRSESDSDNSLPPGIILPRHRLPVAQKNSNTKSTPKSKPKSKPTPKVVKHLGSFEITSGSESDVRAPPQKKTKKSARVSSSPVEVIDLCSEEDTPALKAPRKKSILPQDAEVVVIDSSAEDRPAVKDIVESQIDNSNSFDDTPGAMTRTDLEEVPSLISGDPPVNPSETTLDALQRSYRESMLNSIPSRRPSSQRTSAFSTSSNSIRPRAIMFADTAVPYPNLHTPVYFYRTVDSARKKAKAKAKGKKSKSLVSGRPVIPATSNFSRHSIATQTVIATGFQTLDSQTENITTSIIQDAITDMPLTSPTQTPPDIAEGMIVTDSPAPDISLTPTKNSNHGDIDNSSNVAFSLETSMAVQEEIATSQEVVEYLHSTMSRETDTGDVDAINNIQAETAKSGVSLLEVTEGRHTPTLAHTIQDTPIISPTRPPPDIDDDTIIADIPAPDTSLTPVASSNHKDVDDSLSSNVSPATLMTAQEEMTRSQEVVEYLHRTMSRESDTGGVDAINNVRAETAESGISVFEETEDASSITNTSIITTTTTTTTINAPEPPAVDILTLMKNLNYEDDDDDIDLSDFELLYPESE